MKKNILNCLFLFVVLATSLLFVPKQVSAQECPANYQCRGGCTAPGQCVGGYRCAAHRDGDVWDLAPSGTTCGGGVGAAMLGGINRPAGVRSYGISETGDYAPIGIVNFISKLLQILTIICGVWFMINIIYAGVLFITSSGDAAVFGKFKDSLYYSIIGLVVLAAAYLIAGLIGTIFFGDAGFIIRPTLFQAGS